MIENGINMIFLRESYRGTSSQRETRTSNPAMPGDAATKNQDAFSDRVSFFENVTSLFVDPFIIIEDARRSFAVDPILLTSDLLFVGSRTRESF